MTMTPSRRKWTKRYVTQRNYGVIPENKWLDYPEIPSCINFKLVRKYSGMINLRIIERRERVVAGK
jgi:hypothetical protein